MKILIEVVGHILKAGSINRNQISILTPFEAQKARIKMEIMHQAKKCPYKFGVSLEDSQNLSPFSNVIDVETIDSQKVKEILQREVIEDQYGDE